MAQTETIDFAMKKSIPRLYSSWKKFEFRENTKMLTVLTDNIIDQNHFGNIIRTSLSNSMNSFGLI